MARIKEDGSIALASGKVIYGDDYVVVEDLCELTGLLCREQIAFAGGASGGGFGGGGGGGRRRAGPQGPQGGGGGGAGTQGAQGPQGTNPGVQGPQGFQGNQGFQGDDSAVTFPLLAPDGSAAVPQYSWASDTNTGFFLSAPGMMSVSADGFELMRWDGVFDQVLFQVGGPAPAPAISFLGDADTGITQLAASPNTVSVVVGGTETFRVDTTGATVTGKLTVTGAIDPTSLTLSGGGTAHFIQWGSGSTAPVSSGVGTARIRYNESLTRFEQSLDGAAYTPFGAVTFPLLAPNGTVASPSYSFTTDPGGGMYYEIGALTGGGGVAFAVEGIYTFGISVNFGITTPQILAADGTIANPLYSFSNAVGTGMFLNGTDLGFSAGATHVFTAATSFGGPQLVAEGGSAANPSYSFSTGTNSGWYFDGNPILAAAGIPLLEGSTSDPQVYLRQSGTQNLPALGFSTSPDSGMFLVGVNIAFSAAGLEVVQFSNNGAAQILASSDGLAIAPSYSFLNDVTAGLFRGAGGELGLVSASTELLRLDGAAQQVLLGVGGTALNPALSFIGDPDTGVYLPAADTLGLSAGGLSMAEFSDPADTETALLIRRNVAGVFTTERVSMGDPDSGGLGFKLLRVPN